MPRYAISDIHGCSKTFEKLLFETLKIQKTDELYLLGDYIDRGPDSKGVIDLIFRLKEEEYDVHCLMGNHEAMMLELSQGGWDRFNWEEQGGKETLQSFGAKHLGEIPERYWNFFRDLYLVEELEDYLLVHAGFNFKHEDFLEDDQAMLWIRNWYKDIKPEALKGRVIIHGHTPTDRHLIENMLDNDPLLVIDIDAGCVYHTYVGLGHLCAFDLDNKTLVFEPNIDFV